MTTIADQTLAKLKESNVDWVRSSLSAYLLRRINGIGTSIFSIDDLKITPISIVADSAVTDADFIGIQYLDFKELTIPITTITLTAGAIDVSGFNSVETLQSYYGINSPFRGDFSKMTKLKTLSFSLATLEGRYITPPILSNNPDLETFYMNSGTAFLWPVESVGNLSGLLKLKSYTLKSVPNVPVATINNIITTARAARTAGAPLTVLNLTGTKAPTGAAVADAQWLSTTGGVTVTLGTL